jgi:aspartate aminotransferase
MSSRWAKAVQELKNEGAYAVLAQATALEQQGNDVVHFEIGQPDYPTPPHIVAAGVAAMTGGKTTYCNPSGIPDIKSAIAKHVTETRGVTVTPDMVLVGPGCKPNIFFTAMVS